MKEKTKSTKVVAQKVKSITFVKEGEKRPEMDHINCTKSNLDAVHDWEIRVDLNGRLRILTSITTTDIRPDMVLISESTKQLGTGHHRINSSEQETNRRLRRAQ